MTAIKYELTTPPQDHDAQDIPLGPVPKWSVTAADISGPAAITVTANQGITAAELSARLLDLAALIDAGRFWPGIP